MAKRLPTPAARLVRIASRTALAALLAAALVPSIAFADTDGSDPDAPEAHETTPEADHPSAAAPGDTAPDDGIVISSVSDDPALEPEMPSSPGESESAEAPSPDEAVPLSASATVYSDAEAVAFLEEQMIARETNIRVTVYDDKFYDSGFDSRSYARQIVYDAFERDFTTPNAGDYLFKHYGGFQASMTLNYMSGWISITYEFEYHTTAAQEAEVDRAATALLAGLGVAGLSDYQKVKAIHDWIVSHVAYDDANVSNPDYKLQFTAYAALIQRVAVCQGFGSLFYRLCLESGVSCRYISGIGQGGDHGWNIVELDGRWYNIDVTWDQNIGNFNHIAYDFFLKCPANFSDHTRDAEYDTAAFHQAHPMAASDYEEWMDPGPQRTDISSALVSGVPTSAQLYTGYAIAPSVTLALDGKTLRPGTDYAVSYADNVMPGTARIVITGIGEYGGAIERTFSIVWTPECEVFLDTPPDIWYYREGALPYVVEHGLMTGTRNGDELTGNFDPETPITRAQVAIVLWRLAGEPNAYFAEGFDDVAGASYYYDAVSWAQQEGIVEGTRDPHTQQLTGLFKPDDAVTREQFAKMLAEYARQICRIDTTSDCAAASQLPDWDATSEWAREYVGWAVEEGIITGSVESGVTYLRAGNGATRVQAAKMLMVFDRDVIGHYIQTEPRLVEENGFRALVFSGTEGYLPGDTVITANHPATSERSTRFTYHGPGAYVFEYTGGQERLAAPEQIGEAPVKYLNVESCGLASLDVSACSELRSLTAYDNELSALDLSGCPDLEQLNVSVNLFASLDLTGLSNLVEIEAAFNELPAIDLSGCPDLETANLRFNDLTSIDVSSNPRLTYLDLDCNKLSELDVRACTELTMLSFESNAIASIDVSRCTNLYYLGAAENALTELDISGLDELAYLTCNDNFIEDTSALEAWLAEPGHDGEVLPQAGASAASLPLAA